MQKLRKLRAILLLLCLSLLLVPAVWAEEEEDLVGEDGDIKADDYQPVFSTEVVVSSSFDEIQYVEELMIDTENSENAYEINTLVNLEFMDATEGKFLPETVVTRGEFVSYVLRTIGAKAVSATNEEYFTDVDKEHPYYTDIAEALHRGIVIGNGTTKFRVEDAITYEEALIMLLRAAGYEVYAQANGGYPNGYYAAAKYSDLYTGGSIALADTLTREETAVLLYNFLSIPVMDQKTFGDKNRFSLTEDVLAYYHNMYRKQGRVDATFISSIYENAVDSGERIRVDGEEFMVDHQAYIQYLGYFVDCYYKQKDSSAKKVVYITPQKESHMLVIDAADINSFSNLTYEYGDKNQRATIASNHSVIFNGVRLKEYSEDIFIPENGEVTLVSDGSGAYDTVIINTFHSFMMAEHGSSEEGKIVFYSLYNLPAFEIDLQKDNCSVKAYLNGREIELYSKHEPYYDADGYLQDSYRMPNLPANTVIDIVADKYVQQNGLYVPAPDAKSIRLYISDQKISGACTARDEETLTVEGQKYHLAKENFFVYNESAFDFYITGDFVLNYDGEIVAFIPASTESTLSYGYLINVARAEAAFFETMKAKIMNQNGEVSVYDFAEKVTINGEDYKDFKLVEDLLHTSAKLLDSTFTISQVIKYRVNADGKVRELETVLQSVGLPKNAADDHLCREGAREELYGRSENKYCLYPKSGDYAGMAKYNGPPRLYFKVPNTETFRDEDYGIFGTWAPSKTTKIVDVYDCDTFLIPNLVVQYYTPGSMYDYPYVMVREIQKGLDDEFNQVTILDGVDADGDCQYFATRDDMFDELNCGDFIRIYGDDDYVTDFDVICTVEQAKNFDRTKIPPIGYNKKTSGYTGDFYELYALINGSTMIVQLGEIGENSTRKYMQLNNYSATAEQGVFLYDASTGKPTVSELWNPHVLDQAIQEGNQNATLIRVFESSTVTKFIVAYKGL